MRKLIIFILLAIGFLHADEDKLENYVILPRGELVKGDFMAAGSTVEISGHVTGDVYVTGSRVFIDGKVDGDVLFLCGEMTISGDIGRDVRGIAGHVEIAGTIRGGLSALAISLDVAPRADLNGSIVALAATTDLAGAIGGDVNLFTSYLRLSNRISGNLLAHVARLRLTSHATIGGELHYWSNEKALIDPGAQIQGKVVRESSFLSDLAEKSFLKKLRMGSKFAAFLMNLFYSFLLGVILLKFYRKKIDRSVEALNEAPFQSFFIGALVAICLPLASLIFLITIVGAPFALTLIALNVIGFYLAKVLFLLWGVRRLFENTRLKPYEKSSLFVTLLIYLGLVHIPIVGTLISVIATLTGVGSVVIKQSRAPTKA